MKTISNLLKIRWMTLLFLLVLIPGKTANAQDYRFGIYLNPVISWFNTDIYEVKNQGSRGGIDINFTAERYFNDNIALTGGLSIINSGGRLINSSPSVFRFKDFTTVVPADYSVVYKVQYLSIPVGLKFKTNEIGFLKYFAGLGFDPRVVIRGRVDIPAADIKGEKAMTEIKRLNFGYHLNGGVDYSLDGNISVILGLGFESNLLDLTKDVGDQPTDRTSHKFLKFIFGINF